MKQFTYTITDPLGIHARPAGLLAKTAKEYADTRITLKKGESEVRATQLMKLMALGIKPGDQVTVLTEGPSEAEAASAIQKFLEENL